MRATSALTNTIAVTPGPLPLGFGRPRLYSGAAQRRDAAGAAGPAWQQREQHAGGEAVDVRRVGDAALLVAERQPLQDEPVAEHHPDGQPQHDDRLDVA